MRKLCLASLLAVGVLAGRPAAAATIIFDTCSEASLCNILQVETTLGVSGSINVAVTAPSGYGIFGDSGGNRAFGFNVVGSEAGLTLSNMTSGFSLAGTDMKVNGSGFFEYVINGPGTGAGSDLPLLFTVSRTGGFASDLDLIEANTLGYLFAAHLRDETTEETGFVAATGYPTVIPEPASMLLLGTGLATLVARRRRRLS